MGKKTKKASAAPAVCACSVVVKPGRGHAPWCDYGPEYSGYIPPEEALSTSDLELLAEAGVDWEDWEKYDGELSAAEAAKIRSVGVLGSAYRRYVDKAGTRDLDVMVRLAGVGISSARYLEWKSIGISDVDIVCRAHLSGYDADGYLGLLRQVRRVCGAALAERILDQHPVPQHTAEAVEEDFRYGEFLLYLSEADLKHAVWRCEDGDTPRTIQSDMTEE